MHFRRTLLSLAIAPVALGMWIGYDVANSGRHDLREFDGHKVGQLETAMWRSYYEHRRLRLFAELTQLLRDQFHLRFWKACAGGYYAARAAVVFQAGHSHADYRRALPHLVRYYALIRRASTTPFDVQRTAELELDWWIVHRERAQHATADLYDGLARLQAEIYQLPAERFAEHARTRGDAMLLRDNRAAAGGVSEADWQQIGRLLDESWVSLQREVARR
jgi:hypothetical protein